MNVPHAKPHADSAEPDHLDRLMSDMQRSLRAGVEAAAAAAPTPPPVVAEGRGRVPLWGPTTPHANRSTTHHSAPLDCLHATAVKAYALHAEVELLLKAVTGEERQQAIGPRPVTGGALLPAISKLASEIEAVLNETGRLVEHLRGRL